MPAATDPICTCTHPTSKHDSGGCCRENFCQCSRLRISDEVPAMAVEDNAIVVLVRTAGDPLLDFDIQSADFATLARWAYKAQDEIRRLRA